MHLSLSRHLLICLLGGALTLAVGCDDDKGGCDSDACTAGHETETEGHETHTETEGHETESETEGHETETGGHETETEGHETESETETEGHETETEGHETETEGHETETETDSETEGHETETDSETEGDTDEVDCDNDICAGDSCNSQNETVECGDGGVRYCSIDSETWQKEWGPCLTGEPTCEIGETKLCFPGDEEWGDLEQSCDAIDGEPQWDWEDCNTPLVLSFDNEPVQYSASTGSFDIAGNGCVSTDWPTSETPWLVLDRDRSGSIDGGHELFGNGTVLTNGRRAEHGFAALGELDSNGDGQISPADARWTELSVWADHDGDKVSTMWELTPVSEHGVTSIELQYTRNPLCDARQNCEVERASFRYTGRSGSTREGTVVDIYLACQ